MSSLCVTPCRAWLPACLAAACIDLKAANQKGRNERLNKTVQTFLYSVLADDNELAAKKSLAVLSELWRRNIWRDARTVNCIASAVFHKSPAVLAAALKFFLGQDAAAVDDDESEDEGGEDGDSKGKSVVVAPTKEEVYKATHKVGQRCLAAALASCCTVQLGDWLAKHCSVVPPVWAVGVQAGFRLRSRD